MHGVGNDIIALKTIDISRSSNPRFYSKILSVPEQQLHQQHLAALPFHYFVWLLWSIKESAYKCLQRHQPDMVFSPVSIIITDLIPPAANHQTHFPVPLSKGESHVGPPFLQASEHLFANRQPPFAQLTGTGFTDCFKSTIQFNHQTLYSRSVIYSDDLIHTVAAFNDGFENVYWGIRQIDDDSPANQSAEVRLFLLDRLKTLFPGKELSIGKHASGYPFVLEHPGLPVSLSHHEEFVGYAVSLSH